MLQATVTRWHFVAAFLILGAVTASLGLILYGVVGNDDVEMQVQPIPDRAGDIVDFWFGTQTGDVQLNEGLIKFWEKPNKTQIESMAAFESEIKRAKSGQNDYWGQNARSRLALLLLLDPIAERLNNQEQAFHLNAKALEVATEGMRRNHDIELSLIERLFFYRPLMDDESLAVQNRGVALYERLYEIAPASQQEYFAAWLERAKDRRNIIYKFGRFPQLNEALGRSSTAHELKFLEEL